MTDKKTGREKLREQVKKLRSEAPKEVKKVVVGGAMVSVQQNERMSKMYQDSAKVGSENIGSSLPMLKIHSTNKSIGNELADGAEPNNGWFYYSKTQEQFETVVCHILTISKGFRADGMMDKKTGEKRKNVWNQILGGVIMNGDNPKPFIAYFTGIKLNNLWEFGKNANKYTHAKPLPIPMFALTVELTTEQVKHSFGSSPIMKFKILKTKTGGPKVVTDEGKFVFLRDLVGSVEDTISSLIDSKSTEEDTVARDSDGNLIEDIPLSEEEPEGRPF